MLPLFHVYGLNAVLGQVLHQGARLVLVDGFDVEGSLALIEDEAVSVVPVAPPVFAYWMAVPDLRERLSGVRLVLSGSAPLAPELVAAFIERTGVAVHQGYGLTEAAPVVTSTLLQPRAQARLGRAPPCPASSSGWSTSPGTRPTGEDPGEIHVRGAQPLHRLLARRRRRARRGRLVRHRRRRLPRPDGDLFLVDRLKELVIVSGFNVYPVEVEEVIAELDGVAEAAVIGVRGRR